LRRSLLVVALAFVFAAVLAACGTTGSGTDPQEEDFRTDLQLGTGSVGGTYFPLGGEMATLLSDEIEGVNVSSVESGASVENLAAIGNGDMQLGMTVNGTAQDALNGEGEFEGRTVENFGFITHIYPEIMKIVTLESTGIESIADLEGQRVAIGPPGSATQSAAQQILAAYGLEEGDYQAFEEDFGDAAGRLQDGNLEASFAIVGSPASSVDELQATTGEVKFLEVEGEALETITGETFYEAYEIPAEDYDWLEEPVSTISAFAILVASTNQVDEETGYEITRVLVEQGAEKISHPQAENMTPENALEGRLDLPLHPGAERYYEEQGMLE
jgi:uncharacterized protein